MIKRAFIAALFIAVMPAFAQTAQDLREMWLNPPLEYRMNRNIHDFPLDTAGQQALIQTTLDDGWGGFALNVPFRHYLSDQGMEATRRFCDMAKAKGMDLWLYDEQGYPSGSAGGRVIKQNPAWESMGLFFAEATGTGGPATFDMPPGKPVRIAAFPIVDGRPDTTRPIDLIDRFDGPQLKWTAPEGTWRIFAATKNGLYEGFQADRNPYRHPSAMQPEATDALLRITHDRYAQSMGDDLGRYFTSTFTDEPSSMAMQFHAYPHRHAVIPWHPILSAEMGKRFGYRPEDKLVELYYDEGPTGQRIRYEYFKTVADLMARNYFARIADWCRRHNLRSGGHLLLEESMIAHVPLYGSIMQCFRAMDAPGIDILSCMPQNMPVHSPKLASSAAELMGHDRIMSEPCPVADRPGEPPRDAIRGHLNLLLQGGITDFNCYLRLQDLNRAQRIEMNTYVGRIAMLLRGGHTASEIGVVYPIESLWTRYTPRFHKVVGWQHVSGATPAVNAIDAAFRAVSRRLFERRWEYTHLDSQALIDARVQDGALVHGPLRFKVLLLPAVSTLPAQAWSRLLDFAGHGGKIVFLNETPLNSDAHFPDPDVQNAFDPHLKKGDRVVYLPDWTPEALDALLSNWLARPVAIADESLPLRLAHRHIDARDVLFLLNDSDRPISAKASFRTAGSLEEWDPATGDIHPIPAQTTITLNPWHAKIYRTR